MTQVSPSVLQQCSHQCDIEVGSGPADFASLVYSRLSLSAPSNSCICRCSFADRIQD